MWLYEKNNTEINLFLQVSFSVLLDASVNKNVLAQHNAAEAHRKAEEKKQALEQKAVLEKATVTIKAKGSQAKLFGAVTSKDANSTHGITRTQTQQSTHERKSGCNKHKFTSVDSKTNTMDKRWQQVLLP